MKSRSLIHLFLLTCTVAFLLVGLGGCSGKGKADSTGVNRTGGPGLPGTGGPTNAQQPKDASPGK